MYLDSKLLTTLAIRFGTYLPRVTLELKRPVRKGELLVIRCALD